MVGVRLGLLEHREKADCVPCGVLGWGHADEVCKGNMILAGDIGKHWRLWCSSETKNKMVPTEAIEEGETKEKRTDKKWDR